MINPILFSLMLSAAMVLPAYAQDSEPAGAPETVQMLADTAGETLAPVQDTPTVSIIEVPQSPDAATTVASAPPAGSPANKLLNSMEKDIEDRLNYLKPQVDINKMPSLFFNVWEHDLIVDARRGMTTGLGDEGIADAGDRDISLGGIVYVSGSDWTVWINNTRVTPKAIPAQIMDLKVYKEHVDLEWFDSTTNQIYPIRLRSHQRFNLDTRIFLLG